MTNSNVMGFIGICLTPRGILIINIDDFQYNLVKAITAHNHSQIDKVIIWNTPINNCFLHFAPYGLELNMITCNNYVSDLQGFQVDLLYTLSQS
jgi:hypothetical protein